MCPRSHSQHRAGLGISDYIITQKGGAPGWLSPLSVLTLDFGSGMKPASDSLSLCPSPCLSLSLSLKNKHTKE